jgi:hypothetical protein
MKSSASDIPASVDKEIDGRVVDEIQLRGSRLDKKTNEVKDRETAEVK